MASALAIIHTWPEVRNAEYEVVQRLLGAAANIHRPVALIDNSGNVLWATPSLELQPGRRLPPGVARFALSLHFESPRVLDLYSFYAVWQPISFYQDFGYAKSVDKFSSHNDLLSCASDIADAHALNLLMGLGREPLQPLLKMFHMVAEPYLAPTLSESSKLFYIGVNWERIGRPKGRFHETLVALDKKGLTEIYGPEEMFGVAPWEGFKTYQGELPFDGRSVLKAVNRAGICLALSSAEHKKTGIMSNRLFEGLAGGAAVIATPNPIIDRYFRDVVYLVDDSRGEQVLGQQTLEALREIRADNEEARRRILRGQEILRDVCSLERSLDQIFMTIDERIAHHEREHLADADVTVILFDDYGSVERIRERVSDYACQKRARIQLHVLCDARLGSALQALEPYGSLQSISIHPIAFNPSSERFEGIGRPAQRTGPTVAGVLGSLSTPFVMFAGVDEIPFSDHLASLAKRLERSPTSQAACSGAIRQIRGAEGEDTRLLDGLRIDDMDSIGRISGPVDRGRYLFRSSLTQSLGPLLTLLDGEEHRSLQLAAALAGDLTPTGYASFVRDQTMTSARRRPADLVEVQQQCIRDRFANDPRWMNLVSRSHAAPEFIYAYAPGAPVSSDNIASVTGSRPLLEVGRLEATTRDGAGRQYLQAGFSAPEADFTWLAAKRGVIDFRLPHRDATLDHEVVLVAEGLRSENGREQHCTFLLNGLTCAYLPLPSEPTELRLRIPLRMGGPTQEFRLEIVPDHLVRATHDGDDRMLALVVRAFGILPQRGAEPPMLAPNVMHECGTGQSGADALESGFYASEPDLTWVAGTHAKVCFSTPSLMKAPVLVLRVWGLPSADGEAQSMAVSLNGRRLGRFDLPPGHVSLEVPLADAGPIGTRYDLRLGLKHARPAKDENGTMLDGRLLGLGFLGVGLFGDLDRTALSNRPETVDFDDVDDERARFEVFT